MTLSHHQECAVVIGGSIAGLLSARVLADYFPTVTVVERDKLPSHPEARRGVPQSVQPHVLFAKGYRILQVFFPGIETELLQQGALTIDWAQEFYHFGTGWSTNSPLPSEVVSVTCSRPLLEWSIRHQLCAEHNVQFVKSRVTGLLIDADGRTTGVSLCSTQSTEALPATLVVDASGRGSQAPHWLQNLGLTPPPETVVNPFLGYATRRYRQPEGFAAPWKVMLISHLPPDNPRLGYLARIEGNEWIATLGGYGKDFPPLDSAGFVEFARSLPSPKFYQAIKQAKPVSEIVAHRATANRLRHYEKIQLPLGFVALGDAVCALCPVYGQGMTVSALGATVLQNWLKNDRPQLDGNKFQQQLAKSNAIAWTLATAQDSRFPTTQGRIASNTRINKLMQWYSSRLMKQANTDPHLHTLFLEVAHLLKSPLWLYHPAVVFQVLRG